LERTTEGCRAFAQQKITRNHAEARDADAEQAVAKENTQPVEPTGLGNHHIGCRIVRHMHEDNAADQQDTHQIDTQGYVLINSQTSHPF